MYFDNNLHSDFTFHSLKQQKLNYYRNVWWYEKTLIIGVLYLNYLVSDAQE